MVSHAPSTAVKILEQIVAQKLYHEGCETIVHAILSQAFIQEDSVLHADVLEKRMEFMGYSSRSKFFRYAFRNQAFLESHFEPLRSWHYERDNDIQPWKIQRYFVIFRAAMETYFDARQYQQYCSYLQTGYHVLTGVAKNEAIRLQSSSKPEIAQSATYQNLRQIALGHIELLSLIEVYHARLPAYPFDTQSYLMSHDPSIYNLVANALFDYFCDLSIVLDNDESICKLAMIVWEPIFSSTSKYDKKVVHEIQQRLSLRILRRVRRDMRVDFPPYLLRLVLNIVGLSPEDKESFKKQLHEVVQEKFVKRIQHRNDAWLKHLLPTRMRYDEEEKMIIETTNEEEYKLKIH